MPAYSGSPGRSKSIHYGGGSTYHPRTRRVTVPHGAPAPPAPTGGSVSHAPRHSINRGVVAVRSPSGTVTHYARQTPGISPKVARKRARVAQQRAATVAHSRAALKKAAILHHIAPHVTKAAHAELAKAPPHHVIAVAKKLAPVATAKALADVNLPKTIKQGKAKQPKPPKLPVVRGGNPVAARIETVALRHGLNKRAAAAIAGNAFGESSWNAAATNPSSGAAGLFGFLVGEKSAASERAFAASRGRPAGSVGTQTKFMLSTLPKSDRQRLNKESVPAATIDFLNNWEGAPGQGVSNRLAGAATAAAQIKKYGMNTRAVGKAQSVSLKDKNSPYVYPFKKGVAIGRTDMGVDMAYDGPVRALGDATVTKGVGDSPNYFAGGANAGPNATPDHGILYKLTGKGPFKGRYVYVYEGGFTPRSDLKAGAKIKKGSVIGRATTAGGTSLEMGFANSTGQPLAASTYTEGAVTHWGTVMRDLITGKRVTTASGGGTVPLVSGTGTGTSVGTSLGTASGVSGSTTGQTMGQVAGQKKVRNQRRGLSNAERARRQVLQGAIAALGKTPPKPKAVPLTSSNTTTALRARKTVIAGA